MNNAFSELRRFVRQRAPVERCELCSALLPAEHQHLIEPKVRQLLCACDPCAILFSDQQSGRYKRVPRQIRSLPRFQLTDAQWDELMIPISMAFLFQSSAEGKIMAMYPSPAGATESLLKLESWDEVVRANPVLLQMTADVEALLINRIAVPNEYYLAPIDECYKLVGMIRAKWRGLSGGTEVWKDIYAFFQSLRQRATTVLEEQPNA